MLEICVLSTKIYISQVVLMSLLAHSLAGKGKKGSVLKEDQRPIHGVMQFWVFCLLSYYDMSWLS